MFDFKLTKDGDIEEESGYSLPKQTISFSVSPYEVQRIKFLVSPKTIMAPLRGEQNISFRFNQPRDNGFSDGITQDEDEDVQALLLHLKTEKNDTYAEDVGSAFYKLKHYMVASDTDLQKLSNAAAEIIQDYLPDATVKVVSADYPDAGYFRSESYIVEIYRDDTKVAEIPI